MNNQTYTSQRQKLATQQVVKLLRAGKWPPAGYPWAAVAAIPSEELDQFFRGPIWAALSAGLSQISDNELHSVMTSREIEQVCESRGILWIAKDLLKLPEEMAVVKAAEKELANVAQQNTRK